jgi:hypothetical protein
LLKQALEFTKPVLIVNLGPTRAEGMPGIEKLEVSTGTVMRDVVHTVLCVVHRAVALPPLMVLAVACGRRTRSSAACSRAALLRRHRRTTTTACRVRLADEHVVDWYNTSVTISKDRG